MQGDMNKVNDGHLKRMAYLYVRQSTLRQVLENAESTKRQYALRQRAVALGWKADRNHPGSPRWSNSSSTRLLSPKLSQSFWCQRRCGPALTCSARVLWR
jgi:hypothetical protein